MKTKDKNRKSPAFLFSLCAICLILAIVIPIAANAFKPILDTYLGAAEITIVGSDVQYYDFATKTSSESHLGARELTMRIAEEGIVLMKNNGALPLSGTENKVTLLDRRSVDTVCGGTGSGSIQTGLYLQLTTEAFSATKITDINNPSTQIQMREACKNIIYTNAHNTSMNGLSNNTTVIEGMPPWLIWIILADALFVLLAPASGFFGVKRLMSKKKNTAQI